MDDGWRFRIKNVAGKRYMTARKGAKEEGLGPYSEELWNLIQRLKSDETKTNPPKESLLREDKATDNEQNLLKNIHNINLDVRSDMMSYRCIFKGDDRYCTYWTWGIEPPLIDLMKKALGEDIYKEVGVGDDKLWVMRVHQQMCRGCPAFLDERMLDKIKDHIRSKTEPPHI